LIILLIDDLLRILSFFISVVVVGTGTAGTVGTACVTGVSDVVFCTGTGVGVGAIVICGTDPCGTDTVVDAVDVSVVVFVAGVTDVDIYSYI
jgi:hypothetical protein